MLSRAEHGGSELVAVDIADVVREWAEHWRPLADERAVEIGVEAPP